jgi:hypothetical protein
MAALVFAWAFSLNGEGDNAKEGYMTGIDMMVNGGLTTADTSVVNKLKEPEAVSKTEETKTASGDIVDISKEGRALSENSKAESGGETKDASGGETGSAKGGLSAGGAKDSSESAGSSTTEDQIEKLKKEIEELQNEIAQLTGKASTDEDSAGKLQIKQAELQVKQAELAELQAQRIKS